MNTTQKKELFEQTRLAALRHSWAAGLDPSSGVLTTWRPPYRTAAIARPPVLNLEGENRDRDFLDYESRDAWQGDVSVSALFKAVPSLARLAAPEVALLLAILPALTEIFGHLAHDADGDAIYASNRMDEFGFGDDLKGVYFDNIQYFKLKKLRKKLKGFAKKGLKLVAPVASSFLGGGALGGLAGSLLGGSGSNSSPAPSVMTGVQTRSNVADLLTNYGAVAARLSLPSAATILAAVIEHSEKGSGYRFLKLYQASAEEDSAHDCARDHSEVNHFIRNDGQFAPKGVFYRSPWFTAELDDLPVGTFGLIHTGKKPFRMVINRKVQKPRLLLSYTHESCHAMDKLFKLGLSHDQVHSVAAFLVDNVLPGLNKLEKIVVEDDSGPAHILTK